MGLLITGMLGFIIIHAIPSVTPLRKNLGNSLGEEKFKLLFSLVSLVAFITLIVGMVRAPFELVWVTPLWGRNAALVLMALAFICLVASGAPTNITRYTRHPMLWGIVFWSLAHLLANGDKASLILFGGFGLYSLYAMLSQTLRGAKKSDITQPLAKDIVTVVVGLVVYAVFLVVHPWLFGPAVITY